MCGGSRRYNFVLSCLDVTFACLFGFFFSSCLVFFVSSFCCVCFVVVVVVVVVVVLCFVLFVLFVFCVGFFFFWGGGGGRGGGFCVFLAFDLRFKCTLVCFECVYNLKSEGYNQTHLSFTNISFVVVLVCCGLKCSTLCSSDTEHFLYRVDGTE